MTGEIRVLKLKTGELPYELRRHVRARRVNVRVMPGSEGGRIVLTVPKRGSIRAGERFLSEHADWVMRQVTRLSEHNSLLARRDEAEYRKRRAEASVYIREKVKYWSEICGLRHTGVTIRDQSTRWGSCSAKRRLSFSWKLLLLPERFTDYVVVHELCHLAEFNHSPRFWALVARHIPEYRDIVRELREWR